MTIRKDGIGTAEDARAVLAGLRRSRAAADQAEAEKLQHAVAWAAMHSEDSISDADWDPTPTGWDERAMPVAGAGAPAVAEFCIAEFAAALGVSSDAGRGYLGEAVEVGYRLPGVFARVMAGELAAWKARRISRSTMRLPAAGAAFVDRHLARVAHKVGVAVVDRLVEEALVRFDPEAAETERLAAAEHRRFDVHTDQVGFDGTVAVDGLLDLADALDLDAAVAHGAEQLAALGATESRDVRRSLALGVLARRQLALELSTSQPDSEPGTGAGVGRRSARSVRARQVVLHVHLSETALTGSGGGSPVDLVRVEETGSFVGTDQLKAWCADPETAVIVTPVRDLAQTWSVEAYEIPERMAEQVALRDGRCAFPWCIRVARRCDKDHCRSHASGGPTSPQNLAPLCRRHHRCKTQTSWSYAFIDDGAYLWTSPHGYQFLRDHHGTLDVSRDLRPDVTMPAVPARRPET